MTIVSLMPLPSWNNILWPSKSIHKNRDVGLTWSWLDMFVPIPLIYGHSYVKSIASSELISDKETVNVTVVSTIG